VHRRSLCQSCASFPLPSATLDTTIVLPSRVALHLISRPSAVQIGLLLFPDWVSRVKVPRPIS
jgi:hypothetical protein